jgi:hypothetical protein
LIFTPVRKPSSSNPLAVELKTVLPGLAFQENRDRLDIIPQQSDPCQLRRIYLSIQCLEFRTTEEVILGTRKLFNLVRIMLKLFKM